MSGNCRPLLLALSRSVVGRQVSKSVLSQSSAAGTRTVAERCGRPRFHHHWTAALKPRYHSLSAVQSQLGLHSESGAPFKDDDYPPLPDYNSDPGPEKKEVFIIRAKGLPWSCTTDDLIQFFSECRVRDGVKGIHLTVNRDGKPNGQAFIELEHEEDVSKALEKHRQYLGPRYVEVFEVTNSDAEAILKKSVQLPARDGVVRIRGLPYSCTETDVMLFFSGLDVTEDGVTLVTDHRGRNSGEAYVQFLSQEHADEALTRDREVIGNRYIEVFPSRRSEIGGRKRTESVEEGRNSRQSQPHRPAAQPPRHGSHPVSSLPQHFVHMRGLPFQATGDDIVQFFSPLALSRILVEFGPDGRANGEADVYFTSHQDAVSAMTRDKAHMQERYIELFLNSTSDEGQ
ncbi:G-rich sequence factor 1 isoform X8 [Oncorhynchus keta]|uniref:G-rich sequence factor 1 isoform X2 n=1 Tax=Oncorhynchus keta TaxID=8018 RepID=UPI00227CB0A3|nr:G-rich sequence factor 1 isoform X2 [Oncorhynchus keta]XP_052335843.1 G-rich sequence factor 1 isoform X3 [Oncorhynchus keta]XP_052335844.1 G-rich sequence factor 1 isoform X4 [Oncorhynchus keta]XP_052335845.1 G-rich sequence factor 1 isoform X5 [Oncorhynchus keta]XP_052335846.1 G-rich sequence factor 1 isoform X6 [Oncorhynchus keta]XP_052335847.1 G-rich sequence factor 1 isoform X7 [Oncorhynchus keta]XP_052335848.1 G-rich sequence factor 1 isoform X8 [Oncorhynchus keta]XP_052335849.1 G-r